MTIQTIPRKAEVLPDELNQQPIVSLKTIICLKG